MAATMRKKGIHPEYFSEAKVSCLPFIAYISYFFSTQTPDGPKSDTAAGRLTLQVFCNGVEVMTLGGTKKEYYVDIYSGNHPFYQGTNTMMISDEGQLNKFKKRFAGLEELSEISATAAVAVPEDEKPKKKGGAAGKGGKKKR
jgi:ribosomal protein L31